VPFLSEANLRTMMISNLPENVDKALRVLAIDQIQLEQYMDFLRNRTFRETLLCHAGVPLTRSLDADPIRRLWIASQAELITPSVPIHTEEHASFRTSGGYTLNTSMPQMKAAFVCLREAWPQALGFDPLFALIRERLQAANPELIIGAENISVLAVRLMNAYVGSDMIELAPVPTTFMSFVTSHPTACAYARNLAIIGPKVVNRRHEIVWLNPVQQALLPLLNGTRTHNELAAELALLAEKDRLMIRQGESTLGDAESIPGILANALELSLQELAACALLIG